MGTVILTILSFAFIGACFAFLWWVISAYYPEIKEIVYAHWFRIFGRRKKKEPIVNGDIISLENMIEQANPANLIDKERILSMMSIVWNEGFNSQEEMIRYDNCKKTFLEKFGR